MKKILLCLLIALSLCFSAFFVSACDNTEPQEPAGQDASQQGEPEEPEDPEEEPSEDDYSFNY